MPKTQFEGIWPNGHSTVCDRATRKVKVHFLTILKELIVHGVHQTVKIGKSEKGKCCGYSWYRLITGTCSNHLGGFRQYGMVGNIKEHFLLSVTIILCA